MPADPLDEVLRLVAEGRLTAEEAAPILAALDERPAGGADAGAAGARKDQGRGEFGAGFAAGFDGGPGGGPGGSGSPGSPEGATDYGSGMPQEGGALRLEIREAGRQVVNLRLPVAVGRYALDRVPGLSGEQVDSVREALKSGMKGPILEVNDGANSVRIVVD